MPKIMPASFGTFLFYYKHKKPGELTQALEASLGDRFDGDARLLRQHTLRHLQPRFLTMVSRHNNRDANCDDDDTLLITS